MANVDKPANDEENTVEKVLIVVSAADRVALREGGVHECGYFLSELSEPLRHVLDAGFEVDFATPAGKKPTLDKNSLGFLGGDKRERALSLIASREDLNEPIAIESLTEEDLSRYAGISLPGGHAPMTALRDNAALKPVLTHFHDRRKPTPSGG